MTYSEKLKDPRWQKRRLELLDGSNWTCQQCNTKSKTLHVHHGLYRKGRDPWDYEDEVMHVLCDDCHSRAEIGRAKLYDFIGRLLPGSVAVLGEMVSNIECVDGYSMLMEVVGSIISDGESVSKPPPSDHYQTYEWIHQRCLSLTYEMGVWRGLQSAHKMEEESKQKAAP